MSDPEMSTDDGNRGSQPRSRAAAIVLSRHERPVTDVCFSPDGRRIVSGSHDKTVRVWDAGSGMQVLLLRGHEDQVCSVSSSATGRIVSGSADETARVWNEDGKLLLVLRGHEDTEIRGVQFNPPRHTFHWEEDEHTVQFRMRASAELAGSVARGQLSVLLGAILIADVSLKIEVNRSA